MGTPLQEAAGVKDSVELALEDWVRSGGPSADLEWARRYLANSRREVYDWCEALGIAWDGPKLAANHRLPRGHRPRRGGTAITAAVTAAALRLGVVCLTSTRLIGLLAESGGVAGAVLVRDGAEREVRAGAVIMATGGFANNRAMLLERAPVLRGVRRFLCGGAPQATGSGHRVLQAVGADFTNLEHLWIYPDGTPNPRDASGQRGVLVRGEQKVEIWLNERAERFSNELLTDGLGGGPALLAQPGQHCWAIFDRTTAERVDLRDDPHYGLPQAADRARIAEFFATSPYVRRADSVAHLAELVGLPADQVCAEVEGFNAAVAAGSGREPRFGRELRGTRPIAEPPFFAVEYLPTVQKNLGGAHTDLACRVLARSGQPIPGLYAAGELAGMAGGHLSGAAALENTMFAPSLYSGRVAGRAAAYVSGGLGGAGVE